MLQLFYGSTLRWLNILLNASQDSQNSILKTTFIKNEFFDEYFPVNFSFYNSGS